ncbi:hypothetical protein CC117_30215 [Parafrankia colletiae]|uniref:Uncharacterized protein n=1 Tax=Parafrankia colletiae TaxID=573497 RepID=A0A1S1Q566_9ACTN|nr:hypothetical protein [Parafrankia colletiae]OHV28631.1 hypothetical protein CC117_30215 [Parafrankia colletiae]
MSPPDREPAWDAAPSAGSDDRADGPRGPRGRDDPGPEPAADGKPGGRPDLRAGTEDRTEDGEPPDSEDDVLGALRGEDGSGDELGESARVSAIAQQILDRLDGVEGGSLRIGTLALFNDTVTAGGGFSIGAGDPGRSTSTTEFREVEPHEIERTIRCYLRPEGYAEALRILVERRVLILPGPAGTGRESAAYNLLTEALAPAAASASASASAEASTVASGAGAVHVATGSGVVSAADWAPPGEDGGYLVLLEDLASTSPGLAGASTSVVDDDRWISRAAGRLRDARSFLVLVTDTPPSALLESVRHSGHVLTKLGAADSVAVVERHLLGPDPDRADARELRARLDRAGALDLLKARPEPGIAAHLATVLREGGDLAAVVRELADPMTQVWDWFARNRDLAAVSFVLAAAALDGASYLPVSDAGMLLYRMLSPTGVDDHADVRFRDHAARYERWIEIAPKSDDGPAPGPPRIRYRAPAVQQAVLGYAWTYFDGRRDAIEDWLLTLATHRNTDVRTRAAAAAGMIAWHDCDHAMDRFLRPLAASTSPPARQAAAVALQVVSGRPELASTVWDLITDWAVDRPAPPQRRRGLTAALAAGGPLGARSPRRALDVLHDILDRPGWRTLIPVSLSLVQLIEQGRIAEVLAALLDWSEPQDLSPMVTKALSAFAFAVRQPALTPGREPAPADRDRAAPDRAAPDRSAVDEPTRLRGTTKPTAGAAPAAHSRIRTSWDRASSGPDRASSEPARSAPTSPVEARPERPLVDDSLASMRPRLTPLLLTHASGHLTALQELWARSLAREPAQTQALSALRECLERHVTDDPTAYQGLQDVLLGVAARPGKHRERLVYHLGRWAGDRERPNAAAGRIRRELTERPPPREADVLDPRSTMTGGPRR